MLSKRVVKTFVTKRFQNALANMYLQHILVKHFLNVVKTEMGNVQETF